MPHRRTQAREDAIRNRIHYWKRIKHMMEMHENKEKVFTLEKNCFKTNLRQITKTNTIKLGGRWHIQCFRRALSLS